MRAVIIGGGIGGLTAAIALQKVGIDVHIYERAPELSEVGAGISLVGNGLRALDVLGLGPAVRCESLSGIQGGLRNPKGGFLIRMPSDALTRRVGEVAVLHRWELLALLARQIEPSRVHLDHACIGFEQDTQVITARFHDGRTSCADLLIGADGLWSTVRGQMFGSVPVRYAGYTAWRSVNECAQADKLVMGETWGRGRRFGIVPMAEGRVYWFATSNTKSGARDQRGRTRDSLLRLFAGWHSPVEELIAAADEDAILQHDIYDIDPLPTSVQGRAVLVGDAAHPMTPNLGQGACQAMEDALVLAACLRGQADMGTALSEYERRRAARTRSLVYRSRWLGAVAQQENPILCWLRDAIVRAIPARIAAHSMKTFVDTPILTSSEEMLFRP